MKHILLCTGSFKMGTGGIASYAHDFAESFKNDYKITIFTGEKFELDDFHGYNVQYFDCHNFKIDNAHRLIDLINLLNVDIIVNSSFPLLALISPYLHDNIKVVSISHFMKGILMWDAALNGNYVDSIIALSSYGKNNIIREFDIDDEKRVSVVWNFMPEIKPNFEEKINRTVLKIVYPGGNTYYKSSEIVCKALKMLLRTSLNFEFYWIGNVALANAGLSFLKTKTIADCLPKDPRIKQMVRVDREESKRILSDANIFLLPSRGEGFPISLIEAMRNGCIPVVSDAKHGSLDAIKNGENGFIVRQNKADDVVRVITDIINNHSSHFDIYNRSYSFYKEYLTERHWHNRMIDILEGNCNHKNRHKEFLKLKYSDDRKRYNSYYNRYYLLLKFKYLYLSLYFRYIRYIV